MAVALTVDDAAIRAALDDLAERGAQLRPAFEAIGAYLENATKARFELQAGPGGRAWKPSRRALEQGGVTLTDKGNLRDSITYVAGDDQVEVGTNVVYAAMHQLGGTITAKNAPFLTFSVGDHFVRVASVEIPARPFLGVDDDDSAKILNLLRDHLAGEAA